MLGFVSFECFGLITLHIIHFRYITNHRFSGKAWNVAIWNAYCFVLWIMFSIGFVLGKLISLVNIDCGTRWASDAYMLATDGLNQWAKWLFSLYSLSVKICWFVGSCVVTKRNMKVFCLRNNWGDLRVRGIFEFEVVDFVFVIMFSFSVSSVLVLRKRKQRNWGRSCCFTSY